MLRSIVKLEDEVEGKEREQDDSVEEEDNEEDEK